MDDEILCIDTNVAIWGLLKNGTTEKEKNMIEKAAAFLDNSFENGVHFAISIISLAEFMVSIPSEKRSSYRELISQHFMLLPYDEPAALKSADIFKEQYLKQKSAYCGRRSILRQDIQILASAVVIRKNIRLITEDEALRKLASLYIPATGIPDPPPTQPLLL